MINKKKRPVKLWLLMVIAVVVLDHRHWFLSRSVGQE